ncbi:MAG: hypothetical protein HZC54_13955 [Verrucomicrobia bacterium]|nr:hypothetical protein [Verrucomicrobiota bacterium]
MNKRRGWKPFADDLPDREQPKPAAPPDARNLELAFIKAGVVIAVIVLAAFYIFGAPPSWGGH